MILVNYTRLDSLPFESSIRHVLHELPADKADAIMKSGNELSRKASMIGLLMLENAVQQLGSKNFKFSQLNFPPNQKPSSMTNIEFNITHSATIAACAVSENTALGIDSETRQTQEPRTLRNAFRDDELKNIESGSSDFFDLWVKKESVAKAVGCGIRCMKQILLDGHTAYYQGQQWFLKPLALADSDVSYLAYRDKNPTIKVRYYSASDFQNANKSEYVLVQDHG